MPPDSPTSKPLQAPLAALALVLLVWGALPYLPGQIDDAYIVFAYAHNIVEHEEIAWNTGDRVEGYSSPLHLSVMVLGCLAGLDLSVFARAVSFAAALATLAVLLRTRFGAGRGWLALFVAAWQPFQLWSVAGLETALATLIGVAAWPLLFAGRGAWALGCGLLAAFSLTRPEGAAWLSAGLLLRARHPVAFGRPEGAVLATLTGLVAYHLARVAYFGAVFPTPWLVKIVAIEHFTGGAVQVGWELLSAAPILALAVLMRRGIPLWAWFPLILQAALLVRAGGDWMGNARLVLPGVLASAAAAFACGTPRAVSRSALAAVVPFAALAFAFEPARMAGEGPRWRDTWNLRRPALAFKTVASPPLLEEVAFLIQRVPPGAGAQLSDVGLPGNLEDIRIWDGAGLTDRVVARIIAGVDDGMTAPLKARFDDPDDIWCLRYEVAGDGTDPADSWMKLSFPEVATQPDARGLFWRCRTGGVVASAMVTDRWRRLLARFPTQDGIRREYARAQLAAGDVAGAIASVGEASSVTWDADGWLVFGPTTSVYSAGRGWPMVANGSLQSASLPADFWREHWAFFDVDDPGAEGAQATLRWEPACGAPASLAIHAPTTADFPPCSDSTPRALVVEFLNDEWQPDFDRNLFVTLGARVPTRAP